jgi:hypothetical protein
MNDLMSEYFPPDAEIERRAVDRAFGLLAAAGDAKNAKARLQQITDATAEYTAQRTAAEKVVVDAEAKHAAAEKAEADLTKRTEAFQIWVDGTERAYREREARILANEQICSKRDADFAAKERDLAARVAQHDSLVRRMKELA